MEVLGNFYDFAGKNYMFCNLIRSVIQKLNIHISHDLGSTKMLSVVLTPGTANFVISINDPISVGESLGNI